MKAAVLVFPGINRERDMARTLRLVSGHAPAGIAGRKEGLAVDHVQADRPADEYEQGVAQESAGQQARLAQDLEAVADADGGHAAFGGSLHLAHHRRQGRHRPAAQVVAVGKAAGQHDQVEALRQLAVAVPVGDRRVTGEACGATGGDVVERAGEGDYPDLHDRVAPSVSTTRTE